MSFRFDTFPETVHVIMFGFTDTQSLRRNPFTSFELSTTWLLSSMQSLTKSLAAVCISLLIDP
jgi:hypothetical protein